MTVIEVDKSLRWCAMQIQSKVYPEMLKPVCQSNLSFKIKAFERRFMIIIIIIISN